MLTTALLLVGRAPDRAGRTNLPRRAAGGELHAQLLLPAGAELDAVGAGLVARRQVDRRRHERLDLDGRSGDRAARDELTYDRKYHSMPDWSPDGRWIVYAADDGGKTIQLEIVNVATGESRALTTDDQIYTDPVFSPDGTRLAYVSTKPNGQLQRLHPPDQGRAVGRRRDRGHARQRFRARPSVLRRGWTCTSRRRGCRTARSCCSSRTATCRSVPATCCACQRRRTASTRRRPCSSEQTLYRTRPDVSIDGKRFVYSSTRGAADQFNNLYVQPTVGGEPYKLTFFQHDAFHPRWSPDGEWIAYIANDERAAAARAARDLRRRAERILRIRERRWKRPMGVALGANGRRDATTADTAARIHLTASDGKFYAPADVYARVSGAGDQDVPPAGQFRARGAGGEGDARGRRRASSTCPRRPSVDVDADEVTQVELVLQPMTDMSASGWYSGSTHVHMNYGGNLHNTLENLMMMSAAEDQDIVNEQIANKDNRILDHQFFVPGGGAHPLSTRDRVLVVGQEYRPPFYGHVFMFRLRDHLISPFTTGYEGTAIESLYPSNTDMFRKAKAQGATVGYVHAFGSQSADRSGGNDPLNADLGGAKGFIVDAALEDDGRDRVVDLGTAGFYPWYAMLNNGLRVTAVGGEDSISSMHRSKLVGSARTYVFTGDRGLTADAWFEGLRAGRAFVTTGPLVELTVNGKIPGEDVTLPAAGGDVTIAARVRSITPLEKVTLIFNGDVVEKIPLSPDRMSAEFSKTLKVTRSGWYHLRAEGNPKERYPLDTAFAQAFTNPVWVNVGNQPVRSALRPRIASNGSTSCSSWPTRGRAGARRRRKITSTRSSTRRGPSIAAI